MSKFWQKMIGEPRDSKSLLKQLAGTELDVLPLDRDGRMLLLNTGANDLVRRHAIAYVLEVDKKTWNPAEILHAKRLKSGFAILESSVADDGWHYRAQSYDDNIPNLKVLRTYLPPSKKSAVEAVLNLIGVVDAKYDLVSWDWYSDQVDDERGWRSMKFDGKQAVEKHLKPGSDVICASISREGAYLVDLFIGSVLQIRDIQRKPDF